MPVLLRLPGNVVVLVVETAPVVWEVWVERIEAWEGEFWLLIWLWCRFVEAEGVVGAAAADVGGVDIVGICVCDGWN